MRFKIKRLKIENEVVSIGKSTMYTFVAPGVIRKGRGRGRGLRSLAEKDNMSTKSLFIQSSNVVKQYLQDIEIGSIEIDCGQGHKYSTMSVNDGKKSIGKKYTHECETSAIGKGLEQRSRSLSSSLGIAGKKVESLNKSTLCANQHV
ncbi:hypothetical protein P3S67_018481 [Capsicum chacoense]